MENLYSENIIKYVNDASRVGFIDKADGIGETGLEGANVGNRLAVRFTLSVYQEKVQKIRFQVFGCGFTIAACAAAAEYCEGRRLGEVARLTSDAIHKHMDFALPPERSYCADLASEALRAAIKSAMNSSAVVTTSIVSEPADEHARITEEDPLYKALIAGCVPAMSQAEIDDRQMFACLLAVASQDAWPVHKALGLDEKVVQRILMTFFPGFDRAFLDYGADKKFPPLPEVNKDVLNLLLSYIAPNASLNERQAGKLLAHTLAARAAFPGHLWVAMGFFQRPQLSSAIRRHLPLLAAANNKNMRWKRFLFKQVCDLNGGPMCKTPNCGDCSDYSLCFVDDSEEDVVYQ